MSSLHRLPRRDLESLSAYLDSQLRPDQAKQLEARLEKEADLRLALAELRSTREALRALPTLRPPRVLTLTPEMIGRKSARRPYPALQLATALATVGFLLVSGAHAVLSRGFALGAQAPAPAAMMLEAVATPAETPEPEAFALQAEVPSADQGLDTLTPAPGERALSTEMPILGLGGGAAETPVEAAAAGSATPTPTAIPLPSPTPTPEVTSPPPIEVSDLGRTKAAPLQMLEWLQIGLGTAVVVLAILSLRVRRPA
ncbi:MAG: hypothetical protein AB1449_01545 [Chloroflexota bacterium]